MSDPASGYVEPNDIGGHIIRLDNVLRILAKRVAPPADFDNDLPMIGVRIRVIECRYRHCCGGFELRYILHRESVGSISQTPSQHHFGRLPSRVGLIDPEMQPPLRVRPRAPADIPIVSTEMKSGRDRFGLFAASRCNGHSENAV